MLALVVFAINAARPDTARHNAPPLTPTVGGTLRVGVIVMLRGVVNTYCVRLGAGATGLEALQATGIDLMAQRGPLGAAVCRVDRVGCTPPAEACFCQCQGQPCNYWAYFYQEAGRWVYSGTGLSSRILRDGAVEGWLWSEGADRTPAADLPLLTVDQLCAAGQHEPAPEQHDLSLLDMVGYFLFSIAALTIIGRVAWQRRALRL
jgi:hypothetical protein